MTISGPPQPRSRSFIHYNPERVDYSVTGEELEKLHRGGQNLWKETCLVSTSVGISTLLNAIAQTTDQSQFDLTLPLFLNYLFGALGSVLAICFGIAWYRSHRNISNVVYTIKEKPRIEIMPSILDVGRLSETGETTSHSVSSIEEDP